MRETFGTPQLRYKEDTSTAKPEKISVHIPTAIPMDIVRVDHVGSLLRPESLKAAFMRYATNQMSREDLNAAQDAASREIIAKQEAHGLPVVTDGEYRRLNW